MNLTLGMIMDDIAHIKVYKDSSFAMLLAAQSRGWTLWYLTVSDLFLQETQVWGKMRPITVYDQVDHWFELGESICQPLSALHCVLMRKDPPFNMEYIIATYLLEQAEKAGVFVVNKPQSLRDANEKLYTTWFPQCCPPTLVTRQASQLQQFLQTHQQIVLKPLDAMGGSSVFRLQLGDLNTRVIIETITQQEQRFVMAQRYIPDILEYGDKRILLINGKPIPYALARIPAQGEFRGNLAVGARGEGVALTERDYWICEQVAPELQRRGLFFVGLDVIGDYLTEINVTSPTGIRELERIYQLDIAGELIDFLAKNCH
ncbi:glutathione synthase [Thioflexithrix psekupsensis]|uniref:Glutathione synthetase n=1 Tax=Thioflexithrix psekupsensis TaxID=1570016 RepID=A0A251X8N8_9GAMM|nr:glutathione synthase [Thioflexithrix psekupsensis]OUD14429.1 glutathione synthase [Thioflexithrix psekupsensis]